MDSKIKNFITDLVMETYGEYFELDRNEISKGLEQLSGLKKTVDMSIVEELAFYAPSVVMSLITTPSFLSFVSDTLKCNHTPNVGFVSKLPEPTGVNIQVDFDSYDEKLVHLITEKMAEGSDKMRCYEKGTDYVLKVMDIKRGKASGEEFIYTTNVADFDAVRYCIMNIGTTLRFLMTDPCFYFTFRVKMKHYAEVSADMMCDVARMNEDDAFRSEIEKMVETNSEGDWEVPDEDWKSDMEAELEAWEKIWDEMDEEDWDDED
ncbi:MAG: hypothetical protein K6A72_09065 [Lachnospiraceae bacterium]|nr:hypothetical protein [Lachnospiraceae bacterium]